MMEKMFENRKFKERVDTMNFQIFNHFYQESQYDEIKVIGKEVIKEGKSYHIIGMTLKERQAHLYVMELMENYEDRGPWREKTPRESMKESMESDRNGSFFMHVREFRNKDIVYETAGATSGAAEQENFGEAYLLFAKMYEAGWRINEESPFIDIPWESIALTNIELRGEYDELPIWGEAMEALVFPVPANVPIEKKITLECGKTMEIECPLKNGNTAICYINKVELMDVWAEQEKKFADSAYREKMLQHVSEEELEQIKQQFWAVLEEHCPKGKCYMTIGYECSEEISLNFYDREYLDTVPKPREGTASSLFMSVKPEQEKGEHGYKLRGCVIQKPLDRDVVMLEAELFSYSEIAKKRIEKL